MSNYTKTVNFATKDNLSPGNPLKIVKGTEIDTEYNNIATAIATKTDGAASSTDNAIARFDSTTGKIIQNSVVTIDDTTGDIVGTATQGVFNTVSTTVNAFGAATTLNLGAATGTATVNNTTLAAKAITASTTLVVTGTSTLTGSVTATAGVTGPITSSSVAITGGSITGITDLAVADGGTGASTAAGGLNNLLPSQTGNANKYLQTDGTNASWDAVSLSTADITGTLGVANGGTGVTTSTGTTNVVLSNSPTLVTPALGTPSAAVLTNATGLPISTGVSGLGTGVATLLATPSSANLASAITDETGSGALVFATSPTLVTPILGTPTSGTLTNATGLPISTGVAGLGTGVATFLATPSSANLLSALTDETGTGSAVFATSPTLVTPLLGTPTSGVATNLTGLPLTTGVTGLLPVANGGTGTATPSIVAGTNVTVTGTWPNQTIASSGSGGGVSYTVVKTANYTAANNDGVLTNTTGGAFTVTLPTSPSVGNIVLVIDSLSQWGTNNLTVDPTALIKIAGNTAGDTLVCDITGATVTLVYTGATYGWNVAAQVGGNGGTAVTLTGTQTLTNKTLTSPVLTTPTLGVATGTSFQGIIGNVTPAAGNFTTLGATGVATFSAGTAALPALTTSGDTNTGIFFPAADVIATSTGGAERLRIDSSGNVSIGTTTNSTDPLYIKGSNASQLYTTHENAAAGDTGFHLKRSGGTTNDAYMYLPSGSTDLRFYNGGGDKITIQASGNVGIATTGPNYKLEIGSDSAGKPGVGGLWTVVSDQRIKSDIVPANLERCYEIVKSVPLKYFGFAQGVYTDEQINDKHNLGWIAQDVQKVFKNAVSVRSFTPAEGDVIEDCLDLNGGQMIAALYGAVQALIEKVETLTTRITVLEAKD